jgi:hypothetical protein
MHAQRSIGEQGLKPITVTIPVAIALSGIGKTKFYELMADGRIKTLQIDGKRLVNYASLEALLLGEKPPEAA